MLFTAQILRASWSNTLRLPKSAFPARPLLADRHRYLEQCTDYLYAWQRQAPSPDPANPTFILHDGPPYANGKLHIGHALNKILKDITCRFQLARGRRVHYIPGWDCHGLPIELKALQTQRELGRLGDDERLDAVAVRKIARQLALETVEAQKREFRGWAIMADWDNAWRTMDKGFEIAQLKIFRTMIAKGLIYRRFKPVYWSPSSHTALAEAELEYKADHVSTAAFIIFPITRLPSKLTRRIGNVDEIIGAVVWTTTPWTLPANKAIAVQSTLDYVVVSSERHGALVMAASRVSDVEKLCGEQFSEPLFVIQGSDLVGASYRHPASDSSMDHKPMVHADFVSAESGSGLVHIAPGHGMEDYKLCQQHEIPAIAPVDDHGRFTSEALSHEPEVLAGLEVLGRGNHVVLDYLSKRNAVLASYQHTHSYPYDWRSKQPVIIRATEQWFADVGEIREPALTSLNTVRFIPDGGRERLASFIKSRTEWCISRQRAWGVPIPALYRRDTGAPLLTPDSVSHLISVIEDRGIEAWWTDDEFDESWVPTAFRDECQYRRGKDTMDVWFDSGTSWSQIVENKDENFVSAADLYIEGSDQHRGWFQSSLLTKIASQAASDDQGLPIAPYRTLITHGFTLDQHGKKMSKSVGNVISPNDIMDGLLLPPLKSKRIKGDVAVLPATYDALGPDALRLWVAGCDYTRDVVVGRPVLKSVNASLSKFRVTFKLLLGMLDTHKAGERVSFKSLGTIDQNALLQLKSVDTNVRRAFEEYEYHKAITAINTYVVNELSASYIESIKDRLYADAIGSHTRVRAQIVLWEIFKKLSTMLAPVTPLLVQEACDYLPKTLNFNPYKKAWSEENLAVCVDGPWENPQLEVDLAYLNAANSAIKSAQESARAEKKMGSSLQSFVMIQPNNHGIEPTKAGADVFNRHIAALEDFFVVSKVEVEISTNSTSTRVGAAAWSYSTDFEVNGDRFTAIVYEPREGKCARCWKYNVPLVDPGLHDSLCPRCSDVVNASEV
ncbi:isoleucine-tRNA ligase [Lambiella insularis]|nr:isoleucine-tRNA ligase [Lambiella insularis]